jgi:biotin carboxylase
MDDVARPTILCVSSYFKGNRFLRRCRRLGCRVFLLTLASLRDAPWERDQLDDVFLMPSLDDRRGVTNAVAYLMRGLKIDRLVALDEFDTELVAALREHFRLPGMGDSLVRFFRDKLAMRVQARACGLPVPEFVGVIHHDDVRRFLAEVPSPWLLKPRGEASSMGIQKFHDADAVWRRIDALGDDQSFHLLERFIPGDIYHVDSLVAEGRVAFAEVGQYRRPLLEIWQGGGVFASRTVPRDRSEATALKRLNEQLLDAFGMQRGCAHSEFIRARADGTFYFLETSARVGGASLADMIEAATGLNLWEEWARVEVDGAGPYTPPVLRSEYGGIVVSLARQEHPDTSSFNDPEVFYRLDQKHHIGLVVRAPTPERVEQLLNAYTARIARDFQATLPPADRATL